MVIAFQAVVVLCVLTGLTSLIGLTRASSLNSSTAGSAPDAGPDVRLRLGLVVPANGQASGLL